MLTLMKRAGYGVEQFNLALIRWLSVTIPTMLPRAWGGRIPPITMPGRHQKLVPQATQLVGHRGFRHSQDRRQVQLRAVRDLEREPVPRGQLEALGGRGAALVLDCVGSDALPPVTGIDGRIPVVMGKAARLSYEQHRPVRLSEISS